MLQAGVQQYGVSSVISPSFFGLPSAGRRHMRRQLAAVQVHMQRIACYFFPARHAGEVSQRWQKLLRLPGSARLQVLMSGWRQPWCSACSPLSCTFHQSVSVDY